MKNERLIQNTVENTANLISDRIDEDIRLIQKPSYDKEWEKSWKSTRKSVMPEKEFITLVKESLRGKYYGDKKFDMYAFYMEGEDIPQCYSSRKGSLYNDYMNQVDPEISDMRKADNNYIQMKVIHNRLYMLRNLYTVSDYTKFGTLVVEINTDELFDKLLMEHPENVAILIGSPDNILFKDDYNMLENSYEYQLYGGMVETLKNTESPYSRTQNGMYIGYSYQMKCDLYPLSILYLAKKSDVFASLYQMYGILCVFVFLLIPFILLSIRFLRIQVETPVDKLVELSKSISGGNIGTTRKDIMPNQEMQYLMSSMNEMSTQLDTLFNSAYNEKLLRKDAQIMALQAQINPHFLNNTLEAMNWQARMENDVTVSRMIEALSTVLDHSMNRDNQRTVYLSEELRCVDAYLYIMSMRFGQRLQIEREIDDSLLWIYVPQLILQPIIENAILHGIERVKSGVITIKVHHDESRTFLDVINTGKELTTEKIRQIQAILKDENKIPDGSGKHTSIGIRNVNSRIKLMYGEAYGLELSLLEDKRFLSRITIPYQSE
ncbi:MAG: histidine kinase [Lachnospiraceae bacterium]|nr:histidine kinase [Lachnospiraceae bacterium]